MSPNTARSALLVKVSFNQAAVMWRQIMQNASDNFPPKSLTARISPTLLLFLLLFLNFVSFFPISALNSELQKEKKSLDTQVSVKNVLLAHRPLRIMRIKITLTASCFSWIATSWNRKYYTAQKVKFHCQS